MNLEEPSIRPFSFINQQQQQSSSSSSVSSSINSPIASPLSPGSPVTQHPSTPVSLSSSPPQQPAALSSSSSTVPVVIDYHEVTKIDLHYRVALWLIADILLLTPIREGNMMKVGFMLV